MYTRCPECQTVFRITSAQLAARGGLVRCGRCRALFQAERFLFESLPAAPPEPATALGQRVDERPERAAAAKPAATAEFSPSKPAPASDGGDAEHKKRPTPEDDDAGIPTIGALQTPPTRTRPLFWLLGNTLLLALLVVQAGYFYRDELAHHSALRPALELLCRTLGCRIETARDASRIELLEATRVEPHPRYEQALRVRLSMVNRAPYAQPYPWVELSLTDRAGNLIARRSFAPAEYLGRALAAQELLPVDVVASVTFDVTDPDGKSAGYEIRLVHP